MVLPSPAATASPWPRRGFRHRPAICLTFKSGRRRIVTGMATNYRISEVAERSGFPASTLRYYEDIGLLPAPARTANGYRTYDESTVHRLAFIARARELGASLGEIADLVELWADERCEPVLGRLRDLVTSKIRHAGRRQDELAALVTRLRQTATGLDGPPTDGPCDTSCACTAVTASPTPARTYPHQPPRPPRAGAASIACTLSNSGLMDQLDRWGVALESVTARTATEGGLRLTLAADAPLADIVALTVAEQRCCRFFGFATTVDERGLALEVTAPPEAAEIVECVFGSPT